MSKLPTISNDALTTVSGGGFICSMAGQQAGQEAAKHYPADKAAEVSKAYGSAVKATCEKLQNKNISPLLFGR